LERAAKEETSVNKIVQQEMAEISSQGFDHEKVAAFFNSRITQMTQNAYNVTLTTMV
jgi:tryptophanyl-tRNA synthetase